MRGSRLFGCSDSDGFEVVTRSGRARPPAKRRDGRASAEDYDGPACSDVVAAVRRTR